METVALTHAPTLSRCHCIAGKIRKLSETITPTGFLVTKLLLRLRHRPILIHMRTATPTHTPALHIVAMVKMMTLRNFYVVLYTHTHIIKRIFYSLCHRPQAVALVLVCMVMLVPLSRPRNITQRHPSQLVAKATRVEPPVQRLMSDVTHGVMRIYPTSNTFLSLVMVMVLHLAPRLICSLDLDLQTIPLPLPFLHQMKLRIHRPWVIFNRPTHWLPPSAPFLIAQFVLL